MPSPTRRALATFARGAWCDLSASLVVFLVALPLSLGIALASDAPLMAGLIAAAVGGIVVGLLGGAPLLVSGPAAGLAVMVFDLIERHGFGVMATITCAAGLVQLCLGGAKVAHLATAIPPAVLRGMLAGIGILIALAQLHVLLGASPHSAAWQNIAALPAHLAQAKNHLAAPGLGLLTMAVLGLWPRLPTRHLGVPAAVPAVLTSTAVASWLQLDVPRVTLPTQFVAHHLTPTWPTQNVMAVLAAVVGMALVASTESLLSAVAVDRLHKGPRADLNRELLGQGAANVVSGMLGGLPVTGVIVRSTANITAGARTAASTILHGVWVVVAVVFLSGALNRIPLASLAALLVVVGIKLVELREAKRLVAHGEGLIYVITVCGVVGINLLAGIGLGLAAALARLFWRLTRVQLDLRTAPGGWHLQITGATTFLALPELTSALGKIPPGNRAEVDVRAAWVDPTVREALSTWQRAYRKAGGQAEVQMTPRPTAPATESQVVF